MPPLPEREEDPGGFNMVLVVVCIVLVVVVVLV